MGPRITGVATRNTFAGEPAVQPKSIELALSPQANLAYSTGEFRLTYSYTSLTTGQKEERTLSGKLESSAISQLRSSAIAPAQKDVTQLFIEETKLYVLGEGTRSSPFLSAWTLKCDLKK